VGTFTAQLLTLKGMVCVGVGDHSAYLLFLFLRNFRKNYLHPAFLINIIVDCIISVDDLANNGGKKACTKALILAIIRVNEM